MQSEKLAVERRKRSEAIKRERTAAMKRAAVVKKRRKIMRRRLKFLVCVVILAVLLYGGISRIARYWAGEGHAQNTYDTAAAGPSYADMGQGSGEEVLSTAIVDDRKLLRNRELEEKLAMMAADNEEIAAIYANREQYPEELLAALAGNPEMTDFVAGYPDAEKKATGGFSEEELEAESPLLLQWDSRWGYASYGDSNIGIAGCAPTCLSMVILSLTGNAEATPDALADYSMRNGHYVEGIGTAWTLLSDGAKEYGLTVKELGLDEDEMKTCLNRGGLIICSMRPGDFTTTGHFIVLYDYDANGFYVHDPNSRIRSDRQWSFADIKYQIKNIWGYTR
ncbi:MAG: C39 family peptidase [Lachnospiraceae bacterium]|nr:C39 family peptidase [Lachnospiraceae bacterium]